MFRYSALFQLYFDNFDNELNIGWTQTIFVFKKWILKG